MEGIWRSFHEAVCLFNGLVSWIIYFWSAQVCENRNHDMVLSLWGQILARWAENIYEITKIIYGWSTMKHEVAEMCKTCGCTPCGCGRKIVDGVCEGCGNPYDECTCDWEKGNHSTRRTPM